MNRQFREVGIMSPWELKSWDWRYDEHHVFILKEKKSPGGTTFDTGWNNTKASVTYQCSVQRTKQKMWSTSSKSVLKKDDKHAFLKLQKKISEHHSHWLRILVFMVAKSIFETGTRMQISLKFFLPALHFHADKLVMYRTKSCSGKK